MQQTLLKVKTLQKFVKKYGDDAVISQTITKMVDYKSQIYDEQINKLTKDLKRFEKKYKKESASFYREFKDGKLGDNMDFIEWSSLYQMRNSLVDKKAELAGMK
ncbi:MAG: hypothetical protein AB1480_16985 [Nitrospirota bacterium]